MRFLPLATLLLLALGTPALGDILFLEGGGRVEGVVTETAEGYRIVGIHGTALVKKDRVRGRVEARYVTEVFEEKYDRLDRLDADRLYELALWCAREVLEKRMWRLYEDILVLDPDHEKTRRRLGYVRFKDAWMTPEEARNAKMAAVGLFRFEGQWFTDAGLKAYLAAKKEDALLRAEEEKRRMVREEALRKVRLEEERLAKEKAERLAIEAAVRRAEEDRRELERLERENEEMRALVRRLLVREAWYDRYAFGGFGFYGWPAYGGCSLPTYGGGVILRTARGGGFRGGFVGGVR